MSEKKALGRRKNHDLIQVPKGKPETDAGDDNLTCTDFTKAALTEGGGGLKKGGHQNETGRKNGSSMGDDQSASRNEKEY